MNRYLFVQAVCFFSLDSIRVQLYFVFFVSEVSDNLFVQMFIESGFVFKLSAV